ncbi:hypothetical protein CISG_03278 [Coccidioides immitis RMSCC 3703]|uniref:Uncharacterized protein n=2 Tax=Coccidioides immitis TaxID=5501 RepID=A0A0J8QK92_COCIT|nr:hypothetical protein CISG_03278 [Coccidioides immitis RMSCC 3703]
MGAPRRSGIWEIVAGRAERAEKSVRVTGALGYRTHTRSRNGAGWRAMQGVEGVQFNARNGLRLACRRRRGRGLGDKLVRRIDGMKSESFWRSGDASEQSVSVW